MAVLHAGVARREAYGSTYVFDYDRRHSGTLVGSYRFSPKFEVVGHRARRLRVPAHAVRGSPRGQRRGRTAASSRSATRRDGSSTGGGAGGLDVLNSQRLPLLRAPRPARRLPAARREGTLAVLRRGHQRAGAEEHRRDRRDARIRPGLRSPEAGGDARGRRALPPDLRRAVPLRLEKSAQARGALSGLWIPSFFIRNWSVPRRSPRRSAALPLPATFHSHWRSTSSM